MVSGRIPLDRELLKMDDLVGVHNFLDEVAGLLIVHGPNLLNTLVISNFKLFEALLELDKFVREQFVVLGVSRIHGLGFKLLVLELLDCLAKYLGIFAQLGLEALLLLGEHLLALVEHIVVEVKLLLVELVDGFHVLHALFQDLHLSLELDLLLGLLVRILAHHILELLCILCFFLLSLIQVAGLDSLVLLEEVFNLLLVSVKNGTSLAVKLPLNLRQLLVVMLTHVIELTLHSLDQRIDVLRHLLDSLDVVAVLLVDLRLELFDELLFVGDNFSTGCLLSFDILYKFKEINVIALFFNRG